MFRIAAGEKRPPEIEGELVFYVCGASRGAIQSCYDRWDSSVELVDEPLDDEPRVREALESVQPRGSKRVRTGKRGRVKQSGR